MGRPLRNAAAGEVVQVKLIGSIGLCAAIALLTAELAADAAAGQIGTVTQAEYLFRPLLASP